MASVETRQALTSAFAPLDSVEVTVAMISMNVFQHHVKTMEHAPTWSTRTCALVLLASKVSSNPFVQVFGTATPTFQTT